MEYTKTRFYIDQALYRQYARNFDGQVVWFKDFNFCEFLSEVLLILKSVNLDLQTKYIPFLIIRENTSQSMNYLKNGTKKRFKKRKNKLS